MNELLYHCTMRLLGPGDNVYPGNWGSTVLGTGPGHPAFYREYLLERIRQQGFPDRPSRMKAAFAFENRDYALKWKRAPNQSEYVYSVRLADGGTCTHRGDMTWIDAMSAYHTFDGVEECARRYWHGNPRSDNSTGFELVVAGALVVVERVTQIADDGAMKP